VYASITFNPANRIGNAHIERFNRTYREEVLNMYLFNDLDAVREITSHWPAQDNEVRPHDTLGGVLPSVYATRNAENSTFELSA
jgi:putative transposase